MNKKDIIKIRKFVSKILFLKSNLNLFKFILNILLLKYHIATIKIKKLNYYF